MQAKNNIITEGRLGVLTEVFGPSRLGDSEFQADNIDAKVLNFKDTGQATALAVFFTKVAGVGVDGYVTSFKNFVDDVNVLSVAGVGAATFNGVGRQVEATVGLRNDFTGGEFRVFDTFNNDYDAATQVAEAQGWVAIHGGGATKKKIGLWRYDGVTYDNMFLIDGAGDSLTFQKQVDVDGILRAFTGLRIQNGGNANSIQFEDNPNTSFTGQARNILFWNAGRLCIQEGGVDGISAQIDISGLTDERVLTVQDQAGTIALLSDIPSLGTANGTWTPTLQVNGVTPGWGGLSPSSLQGTWYRVGNLVYFTINCPSMLGTGGGSLAGITQLQITGLPYETASFHDVYNFRCISGDIVTSTGGVTALLPVAYDIGFNLIGVQIQNMLDQQALGWDSITMNGTNWRISGSFYTTDPI